jgi:hypothetical protein
MARRPPPRSLEELQIGQEILLPLPAVSLGRRVVYQRIQSRAYGLFGAGGYKMSAEGPAVRVVRIRRLEPLRPQPQGERGG